MQKPTDLPIQPTPKPDWVSCFSSIASTTVQLLSKICLILHPSELKPESQTHPRCPETTESSEMYCPAAHMNIHTQNTSSIKKMEYINGVFLDWLGFIMQVFLVFSCGGFSPSSNAQIYTSFSCLGVFLFVFKCRKYQQTI